ncbi:MAG: hypothetical protein HZR80_19620 [Candidatus Heimdallarchaeota archaeon]
MRRLFKCKNYIIITLYMMLFLSPYQSITYDAVTSDTYFTLVLKMRDFDYHREIANLIKNQLQEIGINIEAEFLSSSEFINEILFFKNFDISYFGLVGSGNDPDFSNVYGENGTLNIFSYDSSLDYDSTYDTGLNQWYLDYGRNLMPPNSNERIQHYWNWQQYLMDKINPALYTFGIWYHEAIWSTLSGYNITEGIKQSWGKMKWTSLHSNQNSTNELIISKSNWTDFNPLFSNDFTSAFVNELTMDPLILYDDCQNVWPHLASNWEYINDTHIRFHLREGIKWQQDPDGIYTNEYLTADDVFFTYYCWKNLATNPEGYTWIEEMSIIDDYNIDFFIDGDLTTIENDLYPRFLSTLTQNILPEHYLNQTQIVDGVTPDINHISWQKFSDNCFGTSSLMVINIIPNSEIQLINFNSSWLLNDTIDKSGMDFVNRFGANWNLSQLKIKIIENTETATEQFNNGSIDILNLIASYHDIDQYQINSNYDIQRKIQTSLNLLAYNLHETRPFFGNRLPCINDSSMSIGLAIRKAVSYAIDREEINNIVYNGSFFINDYPIYPNMGMWLYPNIIRYNYNLTKAKEFITKAGYPTSTTEINSGFSWIITFSMLVIYSIFTATKFRKGKK